jgi:hypothetical protein
MRKKKEEEVAPLPEVKVEGIKRQEPVGYWCLSNAPGPTTLFPMFVKPSDEHIQNTEDMLGWKWREANET